MAYTGFISDPDYTKKNENETITGLWTFKEVINGTALNAKWADLAEIYGYEVKKLNHLGEDTIHSGQYIVIPYYSAVIEWYRVKFLSVE